MTRQKICVLAAGAKRVRVVPAILNAPDVDKPRNLTKSVTVE